MKKFLGIIVFIAVAILFGNVVFAQEKTDFAAWKEPKNAAAMPDLVRRMLVRDFRDLTGAPRTQRLEEYLAELQNIVADANVVPPTRYNAILAMGQLVSEEATPGNLPVAYPAALPYLVDVYQKAEAPAYLKYGALLGIVRHTNCGIESAQREYIIDLLLNTVKDEYGDSIIIADTDAGIPFEPAIWNWFRQTALEGLSALKTTGMNGKVVTELLSVMNQKSQEIEHQCKNLDSVNHDAVKQIRQKLELVSKTAKTLGDLDYKLAKDIDVKAFTDTFVRLGKAASDIEQKIASDIVKQGNTSPDVVFQTGQIVIDMKACTQSMAWGIRSGFLSGKPTENSFYASINDEQAIKRLDNFWSALTDLAVFFDEGSKANPQTPSNGEQPAVNVPVGGFKFGISELQDTLAKFSETLAKV